MYFFVTKLDGVFLLHFIGWRHDRILTPALGGAKIANFFRGQKLEVRFLRSNLYSNEFIGYVDLSDFNETWPECYSNINPPKGVGL